MRLGVGGDCKVCDVNHGSKWVAHFDSGGIFVGSVKFLKCIE